MVITYYHPHTSGLTIYAKRLSEGLALRGHEVTVLASRHDGSLPREESIAGVRVVRSDVVLKVHKGVISPRFLLDAWDLVPRHDVVNMHLPLLESPAIAAIARLARVPSVITYHCDLSLPRSLLSRPIMATMHSMHLVAGRLVDRIITYTEDYAIHSRFVSRFLPKVQTVYPPVVMDPPQPGQLEEMRRHLGLDGKRVVGFAGRFAAEKGVEHLLATIPDICAEFGEVRYLFAGEYRRVLGENYFHRLQPVIQRYQDYLVFLGNLGPAELARFYGLCDVLVLPSLNSTESFGLVQVEAMLCGTPVVASTLPGVREPVSVTGMGELAPPGDGTALAQAIARVLRDRQRYVRPRESIESIFDIDKTLTFYEDLYRQLTSEAGQPQQIRQPLA